VRTIPPPPPIPSFRDKAGGTLRISVPVAVIVAALSTAGSYFAARSTPQTDASAEMARDLKALARDVSELRGEQKALIERFNRADDDAKNARLADAIRAGR